MFDRNIIFKALLIGGFLVLPIITRAEVLVTELAWMGTTVSANDEWIEIYNSGGESVSLTGWTLTASDGTPSITLSGSIGAGEYKLLERTDDTTYPGITAHQIFTGALANEGENLSLKDNGAVVQSMPFSSGWPAGDSVTKKTMQWTGSAWVTADETAGSATTATSSEEEEENQEEETGGEEEENNEEEDEEEVVTIATGSHTAPKRTVYDDMVFELDFPTRAVAGSPVRFSAQALDFDRTKLRKGKYIFNMGDGTVRTFSKDWNGKSVGFFYHAYDHPGTYQISIKYYMTVFEDLPPEVEDTWTIEVLAPSISISRIMNDGSVEMKNMSTGAVDISKWVLSDNSGRKFEIPDGSVILGGKTVVFDSSTTHFVAGGIISLSTPTAAHVASSMALRPVSSYKPTSVKSKTEQKETTGEVLGVSSASPAEDTAIAEVKEKPGALVWVLLFIILVLASVIAVLLLKREEHKEEYLLIDE